MDSSMKINRKKRIISDLQRLRNPRSPDLPKYDIRQEKANDLNVIYTEIAGPSDSLYAGGHFVVRLEFTADYPVSSPSVAFKTKLWHPNVDHQSGSVCLNSLNQNWQPTVLLRHVLDTHMPWLLRNPNPDDPLNTEAGHQMLSKDPRYAAIVKQWVTRYAAHSQLANHGHIAYKDTPKKKKKKRRFCVADLLQKDTDKKAKYTVTESPSKALPSNIMTSIATPMTPPVTVRRSKNGKSGKVGRTKSVGDVTDRDSAISFQDWWAQSQKLPNTPKAKKIHLQNHNECSDYSLPYAAHKLDQLSLDGDIDIDITASLTPTRSMSPEHKKLRGRPRIKSVNHSRSVKSRKSKRRKRKHKEIRPVFNINADSDLSSMDEDPIHDLHSYESLERGAHGHSNGYGRSRKAMSASPFSKMPSVPPQFPTFSSSFSAMTPPHSHWPHSLSNSTMAQMSGQPLSDASAATSASGYGSMAYAQTPTVHSPYWNSNSSCSEYSKSAGFMPQSADCFMCPDFSPLGLPQGLPLLANHNNSSRDEQVLNQEQERILHMAPLKLNGMTPSKEKQQKVNVRKGKEKELVDLDIEMDEMK